MATRGRRLKRQMLNVRGSGFERRGKQINRPTTRLSLHNERRWRCPDTSAEQLVCHSATVYLALQE